MRKVDTDNPTGRYILDDHEPVACPDLSKWATWMETADRHVASTYVGDYWVSTVFLGLDHQFVDGPPILFETMVFKKGPDGKFDMGGEETHRYSTWDEAEAGHKATVKRYEKVKG